MSSDDELFHNYESHYTFNSLEFFFAFKNLEDLGLIKLKKVNQQIKVSFECDFLQFLKILLSTNKNLYDYI